MELGANPRRPERPTIGSVELAVTFTRMGLLAFGGLIGLLALIEREFVERRGLLRSDDVRQAVVHTRLLPGSGGPLVTSYIGSLLLGVRGSIVATVAYVMPGVLLMVALAVGFVGLEALPLVRPAIEGILAAVVGIQAAFLIRFARRSVVDRPTAGLLIVCLVAALILELNAALVVAIGAATGTLFLAGRAAPAAEPG